MEIRCYFVFVLKLALKIGTDAKDISPEFPWATELMFSSMIDPLFPCRV